MTNFPVYLCPATDPAARRPSVAEQARTAIGSALAGYLTTYPRRVADVAGTSAVALEPDDDGRPVVHVSPGSVGARQLIARPLATLRVSSMGCPGVLVHGGVHRLPSRGRGRLRFRLEVVAVRVATPAWQVVPLERYRAADPDPLRHDAPHVLHHLATFHRDDLTACLRTLGRQAQWVEPHGLDRHGLTVLCFTDDGVEMLRLNFPEPVVGLRELTTGLAAPLLCRCHQDTVRVPAPGR